MRSVSKKAVAWLPALLLAAVTSGAGGCGARSQLLGVEAVQAETDGGADSASIFDGAVSPDAPAAAPTGCVLYGGFAAPADGDESDTWLWDGGSWASAPEGALTPPECMDGTASLCGYTGAAVTVGGRIVFVGVPGDTAATVVETWEWTGAVWTQVQTAGAPSARTYSAVAVLGSDVVLFGGWTIGGQVFLGDTWVLSGATWTELSPAVSPPARTQAAVASVGGKVLLFGGANDTGSLGDTWRWDGASWEQMVTPTGPSARSGASAAALDEKIVLFGGCTGGGYTGCTEVGTSVAETWQWNETGSWVLLAPATSPPARNVAVAATFGGNVVMFGGFAGAGNEVTLGDTWTWDGVTWGERAKGGASGRGLAAMSCW